jgi:hypothetical protein
MTGATDELGALHAEGLPVPARLHVPVLPQMAVATRQDFSERGTLMINRWNQGYNDCIGWLPNASPDEVQEFLDRERGKETIFIYFGHSLASHWGSTGPHDEPVGDVDPWDLGYGRGFYAALHAKLTCRPTFG